MCLEHFEVQENVSATGKGKVSEIFKWYNENGNIDNLINHNNDEWLDDHNDKWYDKLLW